jgi:hypothetical protein
MYYAERSVEQLADIIQSKFNVWLCAMTILLFSFKF